MRAGGQLWVIPFVAGLYGMGLAGLRHVEGWGAESVFALPGYPPWLPAYLASMQLSLFVLGVASVLFAILGHRVSRAGPLLAAVIATGIVGHGAFLLLVDPAVGQGGLFPAVVDVLTLARRHDSLGATSLGGAGYAVGQVVALGVALIWPVSVLALARAQPAGSSVGAAWMAGGLMTAMAGAVSTAVTTAPRLHAALAPVPNGWQLASDGVTYQLAVPPSWRFEPGEPLRAVGNSTDLHANCNMMAYGTPTWAGLEPEERQARLDAELDLGAHASVQERRRSSVAGRPGLMVVADRTREGPEGNVDLRFAQWLAPTENGVYQLTCTTYQHAFAARRPLFERIAAHWVVPVR